MTIEIKKYSALPFCSTVYKAAEKFKIVQTSKTVDGILIKAKATVQLLPVALFIMHYKVFLISESVNEIP